MPLGTKLPGIGTEKGDQTDQVMQVRSYHGIRTKAPGEKQRKGLRGEKREEKCCLPNPMRHAKKKSRLPGGGGNGVKAGKT